MSWILLILGFAVLVVGGELLVRGATAVSVRMGISPMVVGLTVVAIGSSLPELAVGIDAALRGSTGLVTGNIVGTNIVNLLLILGISAAMRPIRSGRQTMRLDLPAVVIVAALLLLLSLGGSLGRTSGVLLLVVGVIYTGLILWYVRQQARRPEPAAAPDNVVEAGTDAAAAADTAGRPGWLSILRDIAYLVVGIGTVILGADWLVTGAIDIASELGVSDTLIGLTVVAIGTSAPELVTSVVATMRGHASMAVGNLIGSSVYNIVFILGLTVVISPDAIPVESVVLQVDMPVMLGVSLLVATMFRTGRRVTRREGLLLVLSYLVYLSYLVMFRV
ncbi:calcium/sodium antiporter [Corynebacterium sp.]|jgi:cation:H+ antiporter|uniref:calcium/sodium antiporter n=1 Tax=Corynebacterium sp. TaxID=1720 RepID=UPI0025BADA5B|nr:calcium/sodium antiporter [Corynebacterium sp.]